MRILPHVYRSAEPAAEGGGGGTPSGRRLDLPEVHRDLFTAKEPRLGAQAMSASEQAEPASVTGVGRPKGTKKPRKASAGGSERVPPPPKDELEQEALDYLARIPEGFSRKRNSILVPGDDFLFAIPADRSREVVAALVRVRLRQLAVTQPVREGASGVLGGRVVGPAAAEELVADLRRFVEGTVGHDPNSFRRGLNDALGAVEAEGILVFQWVRSAVTRLSLNDLDDVDLSPPR